MINHNDYFDAGYRIFGIYNVVDGVCGCGDENCQAIYKHPRVSRWQATPNWSEEQIEIMEMTGQFNTGFGVVVDGVLVVDVDPRNGGDESYSRLCQDFGDLTAKSGFVVRTGGGGLHVYFKLPEGVKLATKNDKYQGIDFKSSGYVVGCGSMHKSGNVYEKLKGRPDELTDCPSELIAMLEKPTNTCPAMAASNDVNGIIEMLSYIDPDCDYDKWVSVGMAIHHETSGEGIALFNEWSAKGKKYCGYEKIEHKWHSFGKSQSVVTMGTLRHLAEEAGWRESVTFESDLATEPSSEATEPDETSLGLYTEIYDWINDQCRFPRRNLAKAAALSALANIGGMRYYDELYGATANMIMFCVAGSATGKEAVQQAQIALHAAAGLSRATYGSIKSEQEIYRNVVEHQPAHYIIDEFGIMLKKIVNASNRGGASYLEGVIGAIMSIYSKANKTLILGADVAKDVVAKLEAQASAIKKAMSENNPPLGAEQMLDSIKNLLNDILTNGGVQRPFLSIVGYTTPVTFDSLMSYEQATNGMLGRALIFKEHDNNPRAKRGFKEREMPLSLAMKLKQLASGGNADTGNRGRIEVRDRLPIKTDAEARQLLEHLEDVYYELSAYHLDSTGLEAISRRGFEQVLKISLALAIGKDDKTRCKNCVLFAHELVSQDIDLKTMLASANIADELKDKSSALLNKVAGVLSKSTGQTCSSIVKRFRIYTKEEVQQALDHLVKSKKASASESGEHRGKTITRYFLA